MLFDAVANERHVSGVVSARAQRRESEKSEKAAAKAAVVAQSAQPQPARRPLGLLALILDLPVTFFGT